MHSDELEQNSGDIIQPYTPTEPPSFEDQSLILSFAFESSNNSNLGLSTSSISQSDFDPNDLTSNSLFPINSLDEHNFVESLSSNNIHNITQKSVGITNTKSRINAVDDCKQKKKNTITGVTPYFTSIKEDILTLPQISCQTKENQTLNNNGTNEGKYHLKPSLEPIQAENQFRNKIELQHIKTSSGLWFLSPSNYQNSGVSQFVQTKSNIKKVKDGSLNNTNKTHNSYKNYNYKSDIIDECNNNDNNENIINQFSELLESNKNRKHLGVNDNFKIYENEISKQENSKLGNSNNKL